MMGFRRVAAEAGDADQDSSADRRWAMRTAGLTFAVGLVALAAIGAVVLSGAPARLERVSSPGVKAVNAKGAQIIGATHGSASFCQTGEVLPAGTSGVRLSIWGFFGARVHLAAYQGSTLLTEGRRSADWTSDSVTVPVRPLARAHSGVSLCFAIGPNSETQMLLGATGLKTSHPLVAAENARTLSAVLSSPSSQKVPARVTIEYLAAGSGSWWSRLLSVARHMGLGRSYSGTWIALLVALMMAGVAALAVGLAFRELQQ